MSGLQDAQHVTCEKCRNFAWSSEMVAIRLDGQPHHPSCPAVAKIPLRRVFVSRFLRWPW